MTTADVQFEIIKGQFRDIWLVMQGGFTNIDQRFDLIDGRLDKMDSRLDKIVGGLDKLDRRFDLTDSKIDALPRVIAKLMTKRG